MVYTFGKMKNADTKLHLGDVQETALIPLAIRANETERKNPDAVCINIGCGLDDRFTCVDNGKDQWFNVNLPDSYARGGQERFHRMRCPVGCFCQMLWFTCFMHGLKFLKMVLTGHLMA